MNTLPKPAVKIIKYAIWFGPALIVAGLVSGWVSNIWSETALGLILAGGAIVVGGLLVIGSQPGGFLQQRFAEVGTNAAIATVSLMAILTLLNFLALRYPLRVDLTENQLFTLSPQTQEILAELPQPLKVLIFTPQENPINRDFLENYRRQSDNFEFEFIDPQIEIGLATEFGVGSEREVYLQYGDRTIKVQTLQDGATLSESRLTGAIEQILRDRTPRIYVLQGHGELPLSETEGGLSLAVATLENSGYEVEPLNLAQRENIPVDADAILVLGPQQELFEGEVAALQEYLQDGGSVLLAIDPQTDPGLDPILEDWGIQLGDRLVIDASGNGSVIGLGPGTPVVRNYGVHPITADFGDRMSVYPLARPIAVETLENIQASPLLITSEQSWAEADLEAENLEFNPEIDIAGPLTLGFALSQPIEAETATDDATPEENSQEAQEEESTEDISATSEDTAASDETAENSEITDSADKGGKTEDDTQNPETSAEARLVVFGNASFAENGWFNRQLNRDVFLNSVKWLAKIDETNLSIQGREPSDRRLTLTVGQAGLMGWLAILIVPGLGLTAAGAIWWRRR
ncbi:MAG: GldG family protein [Spirulinaceae cyanobacterium]